MLWSLLVTMNTNPGEIPLYWGFYIGDDDSKKKRYCLICNAFKPERSHHCSVCNICVLNMDHHCPWVDNCIGFYNRKYFMQLLFYLSILTIYIDFSLIWDFLLMMNEIYTERIKYKYMGRASIFFISYGMNLTLSVLITLFLKFHVKLILENSTTIESLDKDKIKENRKVNKKIIYNYIILYV
jgi:palmitoyltransferase